MGGAGGLPSPSSYPPPKYLLTTLSIPNMDKKSNLSPVSVEFGYPHYPCFEIGENSNPNPVKAGKPVHLVWGAVPMDMGFVAMSIEF